jgi:hypothetical protein
MSETSEERRARLPALLGAARRGADDDDHEHAANLERCGEAGGPLVVRSVSPFLCGRLSEDATARALERASDWRCLRTTELSMWNRHRGGWLGLHEDNPKATRPEEPSTGNAVTIESVSRWFRLRLLT